ncbi:hypothetical protein NG819_18240 [Pseudarthrobacter sp. Fe7]|nr:hypothetical protein NG819_18240 [Pseudarthrobacter sp. Fe7]
MVAREPMRTRKAVLAVAVAVALTGTGAALAWSATATPTPSPSAPAQATPGKGSAPGRQHKQDPKVRQGQPLHSEGVVKKPDGTFQTVLEQRGTVESVSDSAVTVKSEDGYSRAYTVNGDTKVTKLPAADGGPTASPGATASPGVTGGDGKRPKPADGTIADIAAGDTVRIAGVKDGDKATATRIVEGAPDARGPGLGHGPGHAPGLGHKMGKLQDGQES